MLIEAKRQAIEERSRLRTIPEQIRHWATVRPGHRFFGIDDSIMCFGEVDRKSDAFASGLSAIGVAKGDRVAIVMKNRLEFAIAFFALAKLGAIAVPINIFLRGAFLAHQLKDCGTKIVIADGAGAASIAALRASLLDIHTIIGVDPVEETAPELRIIPFTQLMQEQSAPERVTIVPSDPMSILYTSGTTGLPKGCLLSHGYYMGNARHWFEREWILDSDTIFSPTPLYHSSGNLILLMIALRGGNCVVFTSEFSASRFMADARSAGATIVYGVGPMGAAILASPETPADRSPGIRRAIWVPMSPAMQDRFEERFAVPVLAEGIGQTEVCPISLAPGHGPRKRGSLGHPIDALDVRIFDEQGEEVPRGTVGEIVVRPLEPLAMFSGYWDRSSGAASALQEGYHRTGDFAVMDDDGDLTFIDRKIDAIRRRGVNVSSLQIEQALLLHPDIVAASVYAVPAELGDDDIKACIVLAKNADLSPEALFAFFRKTLPYFAIPRFIEFLAELPINAMGRVMKYELRKSSSRFTWDFDALGLVVPRDERR